MNSPEAFINDILVALDPFTECQQPVSPPYKILMIERPGEDNELNREHSLNLAIYLQEESNHQVDFQINALGVKVEDLSQYQCVMYHADEDTGLDRIREWALMFPEIAWVCNSGGNNNTQTLERHGESYLLAKPVQYDKLIPALEEAIRESQDRGGIEETVQRYEI
jgi:hypothetical protein